MGHIQVFRGGGGGKKGGGSQSPVRTPDNLRSKDTIEVILGLGEGPWKGLRNGTKSFYLGDTALTNANGENNFGDFMLEFFPGAGPGEVIKPTLGGQASSKQVQVNLFYNVPVVRQGQTKHINAVDMRLVVNSLYMQNDNGIYGNSIVFRIEYKKTTDATWVNPFNGDLTISGKTTSTYAQEYRFTVPDIDGLYEYRLIKITAEDDTLNFRDITWESFQEVVIGDREFENTTCVKVVGQASDQFNSVPDMWGDYEGKIIRVPSNYNPETRIYTGIWDGSWTMAYSNNPAAVLYDFVTNDRYGLSAVTPISMNKWDVYEAMQWCDVMVPDGKGGMQPRFTFNNYISEPRSALEMARFIAGTFNATFLDDGNGTAILRVDKDDSAVAIFHPEDVIGGKFDYSFTDMTTRHNEYTVSFQNPDLNWEEDRRRIVNQSHIDKYGPIPTDFIAVGALDVHEASRRAYIKCIMSTTEVTLVNFKTNRKGDYISPFEVILVADPSMGYSLSGRIKSLNNDRTVATLRDPVYLESGVQYKASFTVIGNRVAPGSEVIDKPLQVIERNLENVLESGNNFDLNFDQPLPEDIQELATFSISQEGGGVGAPKPFRVMSINEVDGSPDQFEFTAIEVNRQKWYLADNMEPISTTQYSYLQSPTQVPHADNCGFVEKFIKDYKQFHLMVSPVLNRNTYRYYSGRFDVYSRRNGSSDEFQLRTLTGENIIIDHPPGLFDFKILPYSTLGKTPDLSSAPVFQFLVTNPADPPPAVTDLSLRANLVSWKYNLKPSDFDGFLVRYHFTPGRKTWSDALEAHQGLVSATQFDITGRPASTRMVLVKAVDAFGNESLDVAWLALNAGAEDIANIFAEKDFKAEGFLGTKIGCSVIDDNLVADGTGAYIYSGIPNAPLYSGDPDAPFYQQSYVACSYQDTFSLTREIDVVLDLQVSTVAGYTVEYKSTSSVIWLPMPIRVRLPADDYDIRVTSDPGPQQFTCSVFRIVQDSPTVEEEFEDLVISPAGTRLPLTKAYTVIKTVLGTVQQDGHGGVTIRIVDKDPVLGPLVEVLNSSGVAVQGLIDAKVRGFE